MRPLQVLQVRLVRLLLPLSLDIRPSASSVARVMLNRSFVDGARGAAALRFRAYEDEDDDGLQLQDAQPQQLKPRGLRTARPTTSFRSILSAFQYDGAPPSPSMSPLSSASPSPQLTPSSASLSSSSSPSSASPSPRQYRCPATPPSPPRPLVLEPLPGASAPPSWSRSLSSFVSSVQSKLPFLRAAPPSKAAAAAARATQRNSRAQQQQQQQRGRQRTLDGWSRASSAGGDGGDVVIDIKRKRGGPATAAASWRLSGKRRKTQHVDARQDEQGERLLLMEATAPLSSVIIDRSQLSCARAPLPPLPSSFPPLLRLLSHAAPLDGSAACHEQQVEAAVWGCLQAVDRAIQREVDTLLQLASHQLQWERDEQALSFRSLMLLVMEADTADRRLRRLCTVEPQYALYVLHTLRNLNYGKEPTAEPQPPADRPIAATAADDAAADSSAGERELTFRVRRRSRTSCDLVLATAGHGAARSQPQLQPSSQLLLQHRRARSTGIAQSAAGPVEFPVTFSVFMSSSSGLSYPLRAAGPGVTTASQRASFLRPFVRCASSLHVLLLSVVYLALLHTSDAAAVKKAHFASALIHRTAFVQQRHRIHSALQQPPAPTRSGRVRSREAEYRREIYFLLDSCCLALVQADALPDLPWRGCDELALPDLPISHSLGLR